jgi:ribonuclease R
MKSKSTSSEKNEATALKNAIKVVFQKNPTRNLNYKQVTSLLQQHDPVLSAKYLYLDDRDANRRILTELMSAMVIEGDLLEIDRGRFKAIPIEQTIEGTIDIKQNGLAYVMNDYFEDDIVIAPGHTSNALNGDVVKVLLSAVKASGRQSGKVVEIIKRAKNELVGKVQVLPKFAFLIPDSNKSNIDIFIPLSKLNGALDGQKAIAQITEWLPGTKNPTGEIIEVLGEAGDNNAEMNAILVEYGFPLRFPADVEAEAEKIPFEIPNSEIKKRRDMRGVTTFTIDPVDAKDFDDALSVQYLPNETYEIGIHIADVSYFLKQGSAMDEEAFERATSIYLVDRVIPMLPEKLSNNVCSLRPHEDKLCYSAIFKFDATANVLDEWYGRTVIHSDRRFSYEEAQEVIETGKGDLQKEIHLLDKLAKIMRGERFKKGAITFEKVEIKFKLDSKGNPTGVYTKENKDSNKLIEEFMLLANRKVAEFIGKHAGLYEDKRNAKSSSKAPVFVYRIHDSPVPEKLETFSRFAEKFGYRINTKNEKEIAHSLNNLMKSVKGKKEQNVLEQLAIRTMAKAVYTTENIGHYGLSFDFYTHFTSPIRRYPDVMVHRMLDHYMKGGKSFDKNEYEQMCQHSTDMEIKASEAERASIKYKQVQFLQDKKDVVFSGIISGVTEWGFYVEITENKCEGLVRLRDIGDDFYELDEENYCIIGHRSGNVFRLGDEVKVQVKNTDLTRKQIDFLLFGYEEGLAQPRSTRAPQDFNRSRKLNGGNSGPKKNNRQKGGKRRR